MELIYDFESLLNALLEYKDAILTQEYDIGDPYESEWFYSIEDSIRLALKKISDKLYLKFNAIPMISQALQEFESLIKLHYSQTFSKSGLSCMLFESLIKLHYSQTDLVKPIPIHMFESLIKLHYSQTYIRCYIHQFLFESLIKLHYSQTHRTPRCLPL